MKLPQNRAADRANLWVIESRYATSGNIAADAGTVEFWIKPTWNGNTNTTRIFFEVGDNFNRGMLLGIDGANNLRFIQWGDDPDTPAVETGVERGVGADGSGWVAGQWHHVAATWHSFARSMALYVDGVEVGSITNPVAIPAFSTTFLEIGAETNHGNPSQAAFDDFRVTSFPRSAGEIAADYRAGLATTGLALDATTLPLARFDSRRLTATGTGPSGTRDVSRSVVWTTSNPAVATVAADGTVRAVGAGTATITATLDTLTATSAVTVTDTGRPTASMSAVADVTTAGGADVSFTVTYTDDAAVQANTITARNVRVYSANGFSRFATLVSVSPAGNGTPRVATYRVSAPDGAWAARDNGVYTVELTGWQVGDTGGRWAPAAAIGSFRVAVPPRVLSVVVSDGARQRSVVTRLTVTFDSEVQVRAGAFTLTGVSPTGATLTMPVAAPYPPRVVDGRTVVDVAFSFVYYFGSLTDGVWTLTIDRTKVLAGGVPMAADYSSAAAGVRIHRLFGDSDGDGDTDSVDLARFRQAFANGGPNAAFDFDNDGDVDTIDLARFRQRFGIVLPP